MVVTVWWMESWTVVIISLCVLSMIAILLLCCVCWDNRKSGFRQFYVLDEKGKKRMIAPELEGTTTIIENGKKGNGLFRHVSSGKFKPSLSFLSSVKKDQSHSDLGKSMDITDAFDNVVLHIEENCNKDDDVLSCISCDSKHSFYSTYPMARTVSAADTIRSALSYPDLNRIQ